MKNKRGFALAIVMWIVASILLGIAFIMNISKENLKTSFALKHKLETKIKAENFLELLKFYILTADYDNISVKNKTALPFKLPQRIILDGRKYVMGDITFSIRDTSGMIDIFYPNSDLLSKIFSNGDISMYYTMKDSLLDWIDKDDKMHLNGAEKVYYRITKKKDFKPRNIRILQSIDELRLIKGFDILDKKVWDILSEGLIVGRGRVLNLTLLNSIYLSKVLNINMFEAENLVKLRDNDIRNFIKTIYKNKNFNDEIMGFHLSFEMLINITVTNKDSRTRIKTIIDFKKNASNNITINSFNEY